MGQILFGAMRRPVVMDVHYTLACFYTPMRYLWSDWVTYIKEGIGHDANGTGGSGRPRSSQRPWDSLGIGTIFNGDQIPEFFIRNHNKVWNWYWKWPDGNQIGETAQPQNDEETIMYGRTVVNLPSWRQGRGHRA